MPLCGVVGLALLVWCAMLAAPAAAGWTHHDLNALVQDWLGTGRRIPNNPRRPIALLGTLLAWHTSHNSIHTRPAALDQARRDAELAAAQTRIQEAICRAQLQPTGKRRGHSRSWRCWPPGGQSSRSQRGPQRCTSPHHYGCGANRRPRRRSPARTRTLRRVEQLAGRSRTNGRNDDAREGRCRRRIHNSQGSTQCATLAVVNVIGVRELRQNASKYLARVAAGEELSVTMRGRLVARLVPVTATDRTRDGLIASGALRPAPRRGGLGSVDTETLPRRNLSEILAEVREDR